MSERTTQEQEDIDQLYRKLKLVIGLFVLVPVVLLVVFIEFRFRGIEQSFPDRKPGQRDESRTEIDSLPWNPIRGQRLYVPAYSHVYHQKGEPYLLTVTLNIRNTDPSNEIVVTSVRYFDTRGKEIRSLYEKPVRLSALAATEHVIQKDDRAGGSGASFLVEWMAGEEVTPPIVETVNVDTSNTQGISFVVPAVVISEGVEAIRPAAAQ